MSRSGNPEVGWGRRFSPQDLLVQLDYESRWPRAFLVRLVGDLGSPLVALLMALGLSIRTSAVQSVILSGYGHPPDPVGQLVGRGTGGMVSGGAKARPP